MVTAGAFKLFERCRHFLNKILTPDQRGDITRKNLFYKNNPKIPTESVQATMQKTENIKSKKQTILNSLKSVFNILSDLFPVAYL